MSDKDKDEQDQKDEQKDDTSTTKTDDTPDFKAEAEKWKALARKHESQSKANADAAKRLAEMEEADKSESQKAADRAAAAEKKAEEAEARALRLEVASEKGLTAAQAKRLVGATKEELESDADDLIDSFKTEDDTSSEGDKSKSTRIPKERLRSGAVSDEEPEDDIDDVIEKVPRL